MSSEMSTEQTVPGADPGTIIVCSGRCGSTLLCDLLMEHPAVAPLLEFFVSQYQGGILQETITGERFWEMVTEPYVGMNVAIRIGRVPKEVRYDLSKGTPPADMCGLLGFSLPAISDDPDKLMAELAEVVPQFPTQQTGAHCRQLFALLARYAGKSRWVEKSGSSGMWVPQLVEMFPGVRIVYLTRDIVDVALSMSNHSMFLMADMSVAFRLRCGFDPYVKDRPEGVSVPPDLEPLLPENLTAETLDRRAGSEASMMNLIAFQAMMARRTDEALRALPESQVFRIVYEDLLADPEGQLGRLGAFMDLEDAEGWAKRSATRVAKPRPRYGSVDDARRARYHALYENIYQASDPSKPI